MAKPLEGVRVVDCSHVIAGPLASFYLAQLGAEVIKVEPPGTGEVMRAARSPDGSGDPDQPTPGFVALNAGKRSLALDIRTPQGAEIVRRLAATADIFIENFRPGVVAKHGLDYPAIRAVKDDIVYCSISGFGQVGERARQPAYDHVVQALTGMMMMSGEGEESPPVKVGFPVVDVAVGMLGALAIVAALHRRDRDGAGQYIDASMTQASLMLMYPHASGFMSTGAEPRRIGNRGYTGSPTADTYRCTDGWLAIAANTPAQFRTLAIELGLEALCRDARALDLDAFESPSGGFVVARDLPYLQAQFRAAFETRSATEMEARLNTLGVPAAKVRTLGQYLREAQHGGELANQARFQQGGQVVRTPGLGFGYRDDGGASATAAPSLGADTLALLRELALDDEAIDALVRSGAISSPAHAPG